MSRRDRCRCPVILAVAALCFTAGPALAQRRTPAPRPEPLVFPADGNVQYEGRSVWWWIDHAESPGMFGLYPIAEKLRDGGPRAAPYVPRLIELLDEPGRRRDGAACLLRALGSPVADAAVPKLIECLREDPHPDRIASALYRFPLAREHVPELIAILDDMGAARHDAAELLGRIGPDAQAAIPRLVDCMLDDPSPHKLAGIVGRFGEAAHAALAPTISAFEHEASPSREQMSLLASIGPGARAAAPRLAELIRTAPDADRHDIALRTLIAIDPEHPAVLEGLTRRIARGASNELPIGSALETLRRLGPAAVDAVPVVQPLLDARNGRLRLDAAVALSIIQGYPVADRIVDERGYRIDVRVAVLEALWDDWRATTDTAPVWDTWSTCRNDRYVVGKEVHVGLSSAPRSRLAGPKTLARLEEFCDYAAECGFDAEPEVEILVRYTLPCGN